MLGCIHGKFEDQHQALNGHGDEDGRNEAGERPPRGAVAADVLAQQDLFLKNGLGQIKDRQRQGKEDGGLEGRTKAPEIALARPQSA